VRQAELARLKSENKSLLADAKELEAEKDSLQVCVGGWVDGWMGGFRVMSHLRSSMPHIRMSHVTHMNA